MLQSGPKVLTECHNPHACFNGDYYDYGTEMLPCRFLRLRFLRMVEAAVACCADDARLRALVTDDPLFREEYPLLKAGF